MSETKLIKVSDLGQLEIKKTEDVIYLIDSSIEIAVKAGVNAKIIDTVNNGKVHMITEEDSVVNYFILDSSNTARVFDVFGEVIANEINVELTKESLHVNLLKPNASFDLKCLSFAISFDSVFDIYADHKAKETVSNISNVGIAKNKGKLVFNVTGKIQKGMAKSHCAQLTRGVVMDDYSRIDAMPILLIDEYDCFANHGASIGKVSDEDLFYLMSRGLTKDQAFLLILEGIIKPFIDRIPVEDLKEKISEEVDHLL
ncbi:MAG: SufD family Fe-S cluster assembly protein [Acholeplasmatales bacterium]|nr:SufD family Fe-S cluster assembly protein [Acholeplasmatales bacterium]